VSDSNYLVGQTSCKARFTATRPTGTKWRLAYRVYIGRMKFNLNLLADDKW